MTLRVSLELFANAFAGLIGLILFRRLPLAYRIILLQVLIGLTVEMISAGLFKNQPNVIFYNIYMLVDSFLLMYAGYLLTQKKSSFLFMITFLAVPMIWVCEYLIKAKHQFYSSTFVTYASALVVIYSRILYKKIYTSNDSIWKIPELWLSIGLIIFYGCTVPYFALFNFVMKLSKEQQGFLKLIVLDIPNNLRYLCTCLAFILVANYKIKKTSAL